MRGARRLLRFWRRVRHPRRRWKELRRSEQVTVSVVVPVLNAGRDLPELITRTAAQKGFRRVELVIVDSGSTDGSAETAEARGATVIRIPPAEFSHSHARNLGAEHASGDYLLFTVQDASPASEGWLQEMFAGLQGHGAAAVSCGEEPRPDSDLFYRVISWNHHRFMTAGGDRVMARPDDDDPVNRRKNAQISDTACLVERDLFLRYRHRGEYAEDLDLGLRLIDDGYRLAFLTDPRIVHSHNRPAWYHLKRSYVEHLALFAMLPGYPAAPGTLPGAAHAIASACALIDGVVGALDGAASARALRDAVARQLRAAPSPAPAGEDHLDERTRSFVRRLAAHHGRATEEESLVDAVASVSGMICDYLDHHETPVDGALIAGFKAALYKGWALHAGVWLASVYWRGPDTVRAALRAEHAELTSGV